MIALLFALLVVDPPAASAPVSPPVVSGGSPAARTNGDPPIPTVGPCIPAPPTPMSSGGGSSTGDSGGTFAASQGDCAGTTGGIISSWNPPPQPPPNWGPRRVVSTTSETTASSPPDAGAVEAVTGGGQPVRSGGGASSASYAAGLGVAPADPASGTPDPPTSTEHVVSPCTPPSSGSTIPASTGNEPGTASSSSHCPRPGSTMSFPTVSFRTGAPSDGPRRFLGLTRGQWGWVGAVIGAVVLGVIVSDDDDGRSPTGPDGT